MDSASKKRKNDENGAYGSDGDAAPEAPSLLPSDVRRIIDPLSKEQLLEIVENAACRHIDVLDAVRKIADSDASQRKLFIRGLGWETTTDGLRSLFSAYGELQEAVVIVDKATGKSKGYGFINFKHIDGAILALKEPSKMIDGRMTVTQLASMGSAGSATANGAPAPDVSLRKIYVGNVPLDMPPDRLLTHFLQYGEIEEGPLGYDKLTGKCKGYALFVYKTSEGADASLVDPIKTIDGRQVQCKIANDGKRGKPGVIGGAGALGAIQAQTLMPVGADSVAAADGLGLNGRSSFHGSLAGSGSLASFGYGAAGVGGGIPGSVSLGHHHALNAGLSSVGMGTPGLSAVRGPAPSSLVSGGYGSSLGGFYGASSQFGGSGAGTYGGLGSGGSQYQLPAGSSGTASRGFHEGGQYSLSGSSVHGQHHQPAATSPGALASARGGYQGGPYY